MYESTLLEISGDRALDFIKTNISGKQGGNGRRFDHRTMHLNPADGLAGGDDTVNVIGCLKAAR
jgi:hypothetical protein